MTDPCSNSSPKKYALYPAGRTTGLDNLPVFNVTITDPNPIFLLTTVKVHDATPVGHQEVYGWRLAILGIGDFGHCLIFLWSMAAFHVGRFVSIDLLDCTYKRLSAINERLAGIRSRLRGPEILKKVPYDF